MSSSTAHKFPIPRIPSTNTTKTAKKRGKTLVERTATKREAERARNKTRVNIGVAYERWRELRDLRNLKSDAEMATFLIDSYENLTSPTSSTPCKRRRNLPLPPASSIHSETLLDRADDFLDAEDVEDTNPATTFQSMDTSISPQVNDIEVITEEEFNDIRNSTIGWADNTWEDDSGEDDSWYPEMEMDNGSSSEEEEIMGEDSECSDDSDIDYVPYLCVRTGGALQKSKWLDTLPAVGLEETVHDLDDGHNSSEVIPPLPEKTQVLGKEDIIGQPASIVYHSCLKQLAQYLVLPIPKCNTKDPVTDAECGALRPFEVKITSRGTSVVVEWICHQGHSVWRWNSQPTLKYGMHAGDFMLSSNILLSGNNYGKVALLFKFMNLGIVHRTTFFKIQDAYCVDAIEDYWDDKRSAIITRLKSKDSVVALGDGRMDSPGFSAQYCTYTTMDNDSKEIISIVNIDKRETQKNSVIMEKEAFIRTFETLHKEIRLQEFCTDAHSQISALFNPTKGRFKDSGVRHTLDIWHGSKNLGKKIHAAGLRKGCSILLTWSKEICNHFWYCCKTAQNIDQFGDMWTGLLHHVQGEHEWALSCCEHGPLSADREKEWIQSDSEAFQVLSEIVLDEHWLKNVEKFLSFRSTAELESFHNHILMYASKRFSFSPPVYKARTLLAALDYNHHVHRPVKRKADGSIEYCKLYNKKSKTWSLYTVKVEKDYGYMADLQSAILEARLTSDKGLPKTRKKRPNDPRQYGVLASIPPPTTQDLLQTQFHRGVGQGMQ
ncbi:uncharacterized protein LOC132464840 [Gadus macrocephalus]|uniref:uncharacterized protein LOC132464840 n=1 Tax=Gadus macrocephalus TaxID=80720 RepID=UPI0028CBB202|nr:uncharacterized protein LOC132464840 [Gadus macrocephalus]